MVNKEKHFYQFGPFRIDPDHRLLTRDSKPVSLQPKAFDILLVLLENSEKVVLKDDLMKAVWPDTFVEESNLAQNIFVLRKALGDSVGENRYIVTVPGRGYHFAEKVNLVVEKESRTEVEPDGRLVGDQLAAAAPAPAPVEKASSPAKPARRAWIWVLAAGVLLVISLIARQLLKAAPLQEADLVLVSDFVNTTGEPIFDDTLKQALTVKLAESPYFNVVLDQQTRKALGLMKRSPDERVVPPLAREVCEREGAKAVIGGSIVRAGNKYEVCLDASDCVRGDSLAHEQIEATSQDQVLRQLDKAIVPLRRTLGESITSLEKFDTPIEQATTKSLPALKAYTEGDAKRVHGDDEGSIASYKMAIELDPDFAIAYARLGSVYHNLQQLIPSDEYLKRAFERREHISDREKFYIQAHYYSDSTGEEDKAIETYELWTKVYPHDWIPFNNLCNESLHIGNVSEAIPAGQKALQLAPSYGFPYATLTLAYYWATRFAEAKAVAERAKDQKLDTWTTHRVLYGIALMEGDEKSTQRESEWAKGNPQEALMIALHAQYLLSRGRIRQARLLFDQARANGEKHSREFAGAMTQDQAQFLADLGFSNEARALSETALRMMPDSAGRKAFAAPTLAHAGDLRRAETLAAEVSKARPLDLLMNKVTLPLVRAAAEAEKKNPAGTVAELQNSVPYDFSDTSGGETNYYRGLALLQLRSGKEAAAEFQKILDNRGAVNSVYWSLAHLGLARADALTGDKDKSLAAYREFLELWKDADSDALILKQAKAEYAKLQ